MDKNMIFCNNIWRHFRKDSLFNCWFCFYWMSLQKKIWMKKTMF